MRYISRGNSNRMANLMHYKKKFKKTAIIVIIILLVGIIASLMINRMSIDNKTTKIGFEDIGELDTQVAYCTVVDVIDNPKEIWGIEIPFANSKCIYSYDVVVKAGLNFEEIKWSESNGKIKVEMPEVYVTDSYIEEDSGKVYHEQESVFAPITFEDQMIARDELVETAVNDAIANGLYDNAKTNAEEIMTSFFKQHDEYKSKEIVFEWK